MELVKLNYQNQTIEFEINNNDVMVNATEMAKIFNKYPKDFLILDSTKLFIDECLKKENSPFLNIKNEESLVISKQKTGTWMHRVLALKFAAWLNPAFELWVYVTIDKLLFGNYRKLIESLKQTQNINTELKEITKRLRENPDYQKLLQLKAQKSNLSKTVKKFDTGLKLLEI